MFTRRLILQGASLFQSLITFRFQSASPLGSTCPRCGAADQTLPNRPLCFADIDPGTDKITGFSVMPVNLIGCDQCGHLWLVKPSSTVVSPQ